MIDWVLGHKNTLTNIKEHKSHKGCSQKRNELKIYDILKKKKKTTIDSKKVIGCQGFWRDKLVGPQGSFLNDLMRVDIRDYTFVKNHSNVQHKQWAPM